MDVAQRRGLGRLDGQRCTLADDPGDLDCPVEFRAGGDHLLHEADPVRLGGIELVGGEQVVHGIAPATPLDEADGRTAGGMDSTQRLVLAEAAVVSGHNDVTCQHQLDAECVGVALDGRDERLSATAAECGGVDDIGSPAAVAGLHALGPHR